MGMETLDRVQCQKHLLNELKPLQRKMRSFEDKLLNCADPVLSAVLPKSLVIFSEPQW